MTAASHACAEYDVADDDASLFAAHALPACLDPNMFENMPVATRRDTHDDDTSGTKRRRSYALSAEAGSPNGDGNDDSVDDGAPRRTRRRPREDEAVATASCTQRPRPRANRLSGLHTCLRELARRLPSLGDAEATQCAEEAARLAWHAGDRLAVHSRRANTRAFLVVDTLPQALRDLVLVQVGPVLRSRGGICVAAAYDHMVQIRQDMRSGYAPHAAAMAAEHVAWRSLLDAVLAFFEGQTEMRECILAHRIARAGVAATSNTPFGDAFARHHLHRLCACSGQCLFD